jgi:8-oxo-dGTP diphosphatase
VSDEIRAAGGVVVHDGRIAVVHRPKYDDWSLPKGKLEDGESFQDAALREVKEETGIRVTLEHELASTHYTVGERPKTVRWWRMSVLHDGGREPDHEVDELRWVTPEEAMALLDYEPDRQLVRQATS